jgi:hypothetical protein
MENISDSISGGLAFAAGMFRPSIAVNWKSKSRAEAGGLINPFPDYMREREFDSLKVSGELACTVRSVSLKGAAAYSVTDGKEPALSRSVSASVRGKVGRFTLKLSNDGKSEGLLCTVSWRVQKTF